MPSPPLQTSQPGRPKAHRAQVSELGGLRPEVTRLSATIVEQAIEQQPALADSRVTCQEDQATVAAAGFLDGEQELAQLLLPPHEGGLRRSAPSLL